MVWIADLCSGIARRNGERLNYWQIINLKKKMTSEITAVLLKNLTCQVGEGVVWGHSIYKFVLSTAKEETLTCAREDVVVTWCITNSGKD